MFYIQVSFGRQKITVECNLWCQSSYQVVLFRYVDALCLLPLYMYPKTHIARARHHILLDPDSLLYQCKKHMSLLQHV